MTTETRRKFFAEVLERYRQNGKPRASDLEDAPAGTSSDDEVSGDVPVEAAAA
jgi:hypothetical protein